MSENQLQRFNQGELPAAPVGASLRAVFRKIAEEVEPAIEYADYEEILKKAEGEPFSRKEYFAGVLKELEKQLVELKMRPRKGVADQADIEALERKIKVVGKFLENLENEENL